MGVGGGVLIEARRLTKRYGAGPGEVAALAEASFAIRSRDFVVVTGPSGSGKSSLMNLIGLLDRPTGGELLFRGQEVSRLTADAQAVLRNRHIGFIFQSYHLMPRRTALSNVALPLIYRGLGRRERLRRAEAALARVGLLARAAARPTELSGGEQQRVAIARALVTEPELIVADEPTGALDSATGAQILDLFKAACAMGHTVMLVTHDPAVAAQASRRIRIRDGRIVGDGPACQAVHPAPAQSPQPLRMAS